MDRLQKHGPGHTAEAPLRVCLGPPAQERVRCGRELEAAASDRGMLGSQLVRRNDELTLLYERLRLQEATIAQGRKAYG